MNENYKASEELAYSLKQNEEMLKAELAKVALAVKQLSESIEIGYYHSYNSTLWTEGHVPQDVAALVSRIARQRALLDAQRMLNRQEEESQKGENQG